VPTEAELRDLMHGDDAEPGALNTARIIRKAKARRRPKVLAAGVVGGVAAAGALAFVLPAALGLGGGLASSGGGSAADESASDDASTLKFADGPESATVALSASTLELCGEPVAAVEPDAGGLVLTVAPVDAPVDAAWIETTVTLTNTGDTTVEGTTAATASLTLSDDGTVLWHTNGPAAPNEVGVDLDPGESLSYSGTFRPVQCSSDDEDSSDGFPADLPAVAPGSYRLSAAIDLIPVDGSPLRLVTGPATTITLR